MKALSSLPAESSVVAYHPDDFRPLLKKLAPRNRRLSWDGLRAELEILPGSNEVSQLPVRKFSKILFHPQVNAQVAEQPLLGDLFIRLLGAFLVSDTFGLICERFGKTAEEGRRRFGAGHLRLWLSLWSTLRYPQLSRVLFDPQVEQRYAGLLEIPLAQLIAYSPRFVLYRLERHIRSPRNVVWIRWMARGRNIRKAPMLPFPLTKRLAHWLTHAPDSATFYEAMLYGRIRAEGGSDALFHELRSMYGNGDQDTRDDIIRFLARHEGKLDPDTQRRLTGYLEHRRREESDFRLKGRTLPALLRAMREWYQAQAAIRVEAPRSWSGADYGEFSMKKGKYTYRIVQLTSNWELTREGAFLKHCVGSYAHSCLTGYSSIWSLRREHREDDQTVVDRLVTIQVTSERKVIQVRGHYNTLPKPKEENMIRHWAAREGLRVEEF